MDTKNCLFCGIVFHKKQTCSRREWNEGVKFCSISCSKKHMWKEGHGVTQFVKGHTPAMKGKKIPEEKKANMPHLLQKGHSKHGTDHLRRWRENGGRPWNKGVYGYHTHGGPILTKTNKSIRQCQRYINWRNSIFERDNYTCISCGQRNGNGRKIILHVDHIKQFALIVRDNDIKSVDEALLCEELWDINNGRTLCIDCHSKTDTYQKPLK